MEIPPPSSIEQATARFTGLTQQQVKDQIKRIYPYPPINTLLQSKNTLEAISSSGASKDFNEKNLIEAHRLLTPFITNPWQSVQNIEQGKADPRYYDSGISDIKDLIGSTMGTVTGASQINDPRESFVENLLKLKVFKGHVDNEYRADYVKNLFLTQTEMGASYYQTQAIRQNEELSKHFANKRNGISPLSSHTFIQGVNMGTLKKSHDTLKRRNVVTSSIPIFTHSSKRQRLDQIQEMYYPHVAANDMDFRGGPEFQHPVIKDVPNTAKTHHDESPYPNGNPILPPHPPFPRGRPPVPPNDSSDDMMGGPDLPPHPPLSDEEIRKREEEWWNKVGKNIPTHNQYEEALKKIAADNKEITERNHQVKSVMNGMLGSVESKRAVIDELMSKPATEVGKGEDIFPPDPEYEVDEVNESTYEDIYTNDDKNKEKVDEMVKSDRNNLIVAETLQQHFPTEYFPTASGYKTDPLKQTNPELARAIADVRASAKKDATQKLQERKQQEELSSVAQNLGPRFEIIANESKVESTNNLTMESTNETEPEIIPIGKKQYEHTKIGDKNETRAQKAAIRHIERLQKSSKPTDITFLGSQIFKDKKNQASKVVNDNIKQKQIISRAPKKKLDDFKNLPSGIGRGAKLREMSENELNQI